jgi:hypothetical protein
MVRLEGLGKLKINPPHPGLEPTSFQLLALVCYNINVFVVVDGVIN